MVKDKNGTEIKIGDTVHYKRLRTRAYPARDEVFTVTEFVDSPFVKHGKSMYGIMDGIWITGPELGSAYLGTSSPLSSRNAVSPLAVVKVDTFVKKAMPTFSLV